MGRPRELAMKRFTLVELLVTIAVIAVLAALLLPALKRASEYGRIANCASNGRQFMLAVATFIDEHDAIVPPQGYHEFVRMPWLTQFYDQGYVEHLSVLICPSAVNPGAVGQDHYGNPHDRRDPEWDRYFYRHWWLRDKWYDDAWRRYDEPGKIQAPNNSMGTYLYFGGSVGTPHDPVEQPAWVFNTAHGYLLKLQQVRRPDAYAILSDRAAPTRWWMTSGNHVLSGGVNFAFMDGHVECRQRIFDNSQTLVHKSFITPVMGPHSVMWQGLSYTRSNLPAEARAILSP